MSSIPSREEALCADALAQPDEERGAFLAKVCGTDVALLARIAGLIAAHEGTQSLLASSPAPSPTVGEENPGETIGHYKLLQKIGEGGTLSSVAEVRDHSARYRLLQKIGEGGCGVVWMAEQEEPVRRRVALKVIKLGMDTKAVVARFEAERQALAMMDHPNIAKVHDAGSTDTGRPYFVMELVRGIQITKYCDENHLTPTERLELFIKVCQAVQHAHQKGIIHRDIKPSNILVTVNDGQPTPKIIDFGIAKATQGKLTDATVFTQFEQFIGTPVYMSPEQAEMSSLDIDTRSDIYSLGILLYELLTGRPPFDPKHFAQAGVDQVRRELREVEPPRPSARLRTLSNEEQTTIARLRHTAPSQLSVILRGDLDWIVMRCIEKDRTRRYDTANGLAADIERYLRNEPVVARPPSTAYLLQKLIRRHRFGFAAATAIFGVICVGGFVSTWQAVRAKRAEHEQVRLRRVAQQAQVKEGELRRTEAELRRHAEAEELNARQRAYAADINVLQQVLEAGNLGRARELLDRQRPTPGKRDLRDWEWRYLWQFCQGDPRTLILRKEGYAEPLLVSADGNWIAVGGWGQQVRNLRTGQEIRPPVANVFAAAFSPQHPVLAMSAAEFKADGTIQYFVALWNFATGSLEQRRNFPSQCLSLNFSRDGRVLVTSTAAPDDKINVWALPGWTQLATLPAEQQRARADSFAISPDLRLAAHRLRDAKNTIRLVDLNSGGERWTAVAADESVATLEFSPNGEVLASGAAYQDGTIRLWDVASGKEIGRLEGHRSWVTDLVFWPDGKTLASASADQTVRVWDVTSANCVRTLRGHDNEVHALVRLPDGGLLSGAKDGAVYRWHMESNVEKPAVTLPAEIVCWRLSGDGRSILTLETNGNVAEWRGRNFQERTELMNVGPCTGIHAIFSAAHPLLAMQSAAGSMTVFDFETHKAMRELRVSNKPAVPVAFYKQDEHLIVFTDNPARYSEWNVVTGRELASWAAPSGTQRGLTFSRDETTALMIGSTGEAIVRDMHKRGSTIYELGILYLKGPEYSPDGRYFAAPSELGLAVLWDTATHQEAAVFTGFMFGVHSVGFSPNGARLATGGEGGDEAVTLWDVESRQHLLTFNCKGSVFSRIAFSASGDVLGAYSGMSRTLHLWRAPSWTEIAAAEKADAARDRP